MRLTGIQGARTRSGLLLVDRDEPDRIRIGDKGGGSMGAMCGRVPPSTYPLPLNISPGMASYALDCAYYGILRRQYLCDDGARPGQGEEPAQAFNPQFFGVPREG